MFIYDSVLNTVSDLFPFSFTSNFVHFTIISSILTIFVMIFFIYTLFCQFFKYYLLSGFYSPQIMYMFTRNSVPITVSSYMPISIYILSRYLYKRIFHTYTSFYDFFPLHLFMSIFTLFIYAFSIYHRSCSCLHMILYLLP
jgi:hypothetical protein